MAGQRRRVVVTGLGVVTPVGIGVQPTWESLLAGKSGAAPITIFDHSKHDVHFACEIKNFDPANYMDLRETKRMDRFCQLGVVAANESIKDSHIDFSKCDTSRVGVLIGTGVGGITETEEQKVRLITKGPERVSAMLIPKLMGNAAAAMVSIQHKLRGPNYTIVTACAAAANSLGSALRHVQYGEADVMVAGGTESAITPLAIAGFANMGALSKRNDAAETASRPFDKDRDGFVMGEGAGVLVLEELEHALKRDARIYCEFAGYGLSGDGYHITAPCMDGDGGIRAMSGAIHDAGLKPSDIDYVNAHGTSTPFNDKIETLAIKKVFGDHAAKLAVNSTKSMTGHTLGAAGGVEAVVMAMTIAHDTMHPTINQFTPDPECDLDYIKEGVRKKPVRAAISNSLGFGGHNGTLCFTKFKK